MRRTSCVTVFLCALGIVSVGSTTALAVAPAYDLIPLGRLASGDVTRAEALNNLGHVVGYSAGKAFLWTPKTGMQALPGLGGTSWSATDINDDGVIVGSARPSGSSSEKPVRWVGGVIEQLSIQSGWAQVIAENGLIGGSLSSRKAFIYDTELHVIDEGPYAGLLDMNDHGTAVGYVDLSTPVVWENGERRELTADGPMKATAINNNGWIVGYGSGSPVLWRGDEVIPLEPDLPGFSATVTAINDSGQVVGWVPLGWMPEMFTFLWEDGNLFDLQPLLLPEDSEWELSEINDINESGQMVGIGTHPTLGSQAILLTPVPEPASLTLLMVAVMVILGAVRNRRS